MMRAKLHISAQRYGWNQAVEQYEKSRLQPLEPVHKLLVETAGLQPGEKVIDVASGTGRASILAAEAVGPEGLVIGADLSDRMVSIASASAFRLGLRRVSFYRMNAENLECIDNAFDAALNAFGLMYFPHPSRAVAEMRRVLTPEGRAVAAVWGRPEYCGWSAIFQIIQSYSRIDINPGFFHLGMKDNLRGLFRNEGFKEVDCQRIDHTLYYPSAESALDAVLADGSLTLAYERLDPVTKERVAEEYLTSIELYRDGEEYFVPAELVMVKASINQPGSDTIA
jgi:ubiquinone/menaquinone biosynthesis C-methylase UbiE